MSCMHRVCCQVVKMVSEERYSHPESQQFSGYFSFLLHFIVACPPLDLHKGASESIEYDTGCKFYLCAIHAKVCIFRQQLRRIWIYNCRVPRPPVSFWVKNSTDLFNTNQAPTWLGLTWWLGLRARQGQGFFQRGAASNLSFATFDFDLIGWFIW